MKIPYLFLFLALLFVTGGIALLWMHVSDWGYDKPLKVSESMAVSGDFTWQSQFMISSVRKPMLCAQALIAVISLVLAQRLSHERLRWFVVAVLIAGQMIFYFYWCHSIDEVILSWNPNVPPYEGPTAREHLVRRALDLRVLMGSVIIAYFVTVISIARRKRSAVSVIAA